MLIGCCIAFVVGLLLGKRGIEPIRRFVLSYREAPVEGGLAIRGGGYWQRLRFMEEKQSSGQLEVLRSLPYVTGSRSSRSAIHISLGADAERGFGYFLYSSAHQPEAYLIDRQGRIRHSWYRDRDDVWHGMVGMDEGKANRYFRRVRILDDGSLLAIYEYIGIVRLGRDGDLMWEHQGWNHHDLDIDEQGRVYVLGRDISDVGESSRDGARPVPGGRRIRGRWVYDENITILGTDGETLKHISLVSCLESSRFAPLLDEIAQFNSEMPNDLLHANTLRILDGSCAHLSPAFKKGNILTSFRNISTIAVIDPDQETVVWAVKGAWRQQHDPWLLPSGTMLLFDNYATDLGTPISAAESRVVEFNPLTLEVIWEYRGSSEEPFFSSLMGTVQRLPGGNTLITESDFGRAFEVDTDGRVVWEFNSPHTAGENNEYVAVVPEFTYIPAEEVPEILIADENP